MNLAQRSLTLLIRAYQAVVSPALGAFFGPAGRCRYTPSCSHYALEAVRVHGAWAGAFLAVRRLCRCHPWAGFGEDPVPKPAAGSLDQNLALDLAPGLARPDAQCGRSPSRPMSQ